MSIVKISLILLSVSILSFNFSFGQNFATPEITFKQYEISIGSAKRQTVLTGFILSDSVAELAVINIDENNDRRLRIFSFADSTWKMQLAVNLRPKVVFVDVANIGGKDRLITYEHGRLNLFDPDSATERFLLTVISNFNPPRKNEIPHVDITHDVNNDGLDDLVVPDKNGFQVIIQMKDGIFADPVKIGRPTKMDRILGSDGYRYNPWSQSRIYESDYNRDGRNDLAFWSEDHFEVHLQDEQGLFASDTRIFNTDVVFKSDNLSYLSSGDMRGKVLHSLADLNSDGITDMVIFSLQGKEIADKQTSYEVHFGTLTNDDGIAFAPEVGITFKSEERIQIAMDRHDFNGDSHTDLMITTINREHLESRLWKKFKGMMGDDIKLDVEFFRMQDGRYPDQPNAIRSIALDGIPSHSEPGWVSLQIVLQGGLHENRARHEDWPRAFNMTMLIGDVSGDGHAELFIGKNTPNGLDVFAGLPGPELFPRQAEDVPVAIPNDAEYSWLTDFNKDGKQDIIIHDPFTLRDDHGAPTQPPGTEPHRVKILISQ